MARVTLRVVGGRAASRFAGMGLPGSFWAGGVVCASLTVRVCVIGGRSDNPCIGYHGG